MSWWQMSPYKQGAKATNPMNTSLSLGYTEGMKLSVEMRFLNANKIMSPSQKRKFFSDYNSNSVKRVGFTQEMLFFSWILTFPKVSHSKEWGKAYRMVGKENVTNPMTTNLSLGYTENRNFPVETCFLNANKIMSPSHKRKVFSFPKESHSKEWGKAYRMVGKVCYVLGLRFIHNCNESPEGFQNHIKSTQFNCSDLITPLIELQNIVKNINLHI